MEIDALKRTLRNLKKLEYTIRFNNQIPDKNVYVVWDTFFSTKDSRKKVVKYPLHKLMALRRHELKDIISDYFLEVYMQFFKENDPNNDFFDSTLLSKLGLPADSEYKDIKRRFRELAKKYHPDHGGDSAEFIKLMEIYRELTTNMEKKE